MTSPPYSTRHPPLELGTPLQSIHLRLEVRELPAAVKAGSDVIRLVRPYVEGLHREAFFSMPLNARHQPLGVHLVSLGTTTSSLVHPRDVFLPAVLAGATALVVCHNHPSGDPTPSADDRMVTDRLRQVGDLLGIELLDHLVVGRDSFFSFSTEQASSIPA